MPDKSARSRSWKTGALRAARAAAFLTLATGVNGTVSAYFPAYEPFYVYLVSVVVVAWLSGILLGVTTAVAAVVLYDWMFSPLATTGPSVISAVPLAVAVTAAVVTQLARAPIRRQALPATASPPALLTGTVIRDTAADRRISDLEAQLAQAHTSSRLRAEALQEAADRHSALNQELEAARAAVGEQNARSASMRRDVEAAKQRNLELDGRLAAIQQELEVAYRKIDEERAHKTDGARFETEARDLTARLSLTTEQAGKLKQELDAANRKLDEERARRSDGSRFEAEARELAGRLRLVTEQAGKLRQELDAANRKLDEERARKTDGTRLAGETNELTARLSLTTEQLGKLRRELDDARRIADAERARGDREASLRAQMENAARQTLQRTADVASSHQRSEEEARKAQQAAEARTELLQQELDRVRVILEDETTRADREAELREHLELTGGDKLLLIAGDLTTRTKERDAALAEIATLRQHLEAARSARMAMDVEFDAKLQKVVAGLTEDYEQFIGVSIVEKEAARAENRALTKRLESLQRKLAEGSEASRQRLVEVEKNMAERERLAGELQAVRHDLAAEKKALTARVEDLEAQLDAERKTRDQMEADFDARLQKVVTGLTEDYEQFIGVSVVDKEEARAKNRHLTARVEELQKQLDAEKNARAGAEADFDSKLQKVVTGLTEDYEQFIGVSVVDKEAARAENRSLTAKVQELKEARQKLEIEWSEKLQKIVTNLASDHESDLGTAMAEKEMARAEARSLQKRLQDEREHFRRLTERWQKEREELLARGAVKEPEPFPGTGAKAPVVLVVHSDSGVRAMCKHALEQSGYTILTAADGLEGLRVASSGKPDVVLAEAIMPKMNGRELVQLLKSRRETAGMKIILMSGADSADIERGSDFRADDFLRSATDVDAMRTTLASVLSKGR